MTAIKTLPFIAVPLLAKFSGWEGWLAPALPTAKFLRCSPGLLFLSASQECFRFLHLWTGGIGVTRKRHEFSVITLCRLLISREPSSTRCAVETIEPVRRLDQRGLEFF